MTHLWVFVGQKKVNKQTVTKLQKKKHTHTHK